MIGSNSWKFFYNNRGSISMKFWIAQVHKIPQLTTVSRARICLEKCLFSSTGLGWFSFLIFDYLCLLNRVTCEHNVEIRENSGLKNPLTGSITTWWRIIFTRTWVASFMNKYAWSIVPMTKFRLGIRKRLFTMRLLKHWNKFPGEMIDALFLETIKSDRMGFWAIWSSWRCCYPWKRSWSRWTVLSNYSMILWVYDSV